MGTLRAHVVTTLRALATILNAVLILPATLYASPLQASNQECVVLLHGWAKSGRCMIPVEESLTKEGYKVQNITYPTRYYKIEDIVNKYIYPNVKTEGCTKLHFVGHSLGGIVTRYYIEKYRPKNLGRVVLIGSPSKGSEIVDKISGPYFINKILGPAVLELSTHSTFLSSLKNPDYDLGIISGDISLNPFTSIFILPGPDDGIVSLESTKVEGMKDQITLSSTHVMILKNHTTHEEISCFLENGRFCAK
ncbi:MAG: hypothetical protein KA998_02615 [Rickettsiaceae bacterium]|nr:hypothetical protein [Rickettsiaceae bacterium]